MEWNGWEIVCGELRSISMDLEEFVC